MKNNLDNKKIIGFDMDGVIIDHVGNKLKVAKTLGLKLKKEHTPSDIMRGALPQPIWEKIQRTLFDNASVALSPPLMPGVKTVLKKLRDGKVPYFLVSRRKKPAMAIKLLKEKKLWPEYFNKNNAFFVISREDKDEKSSELKITHYFDDQNSVLDKLLSVKNKFLFDHLGVFKKNPYPVVSSWKEISELI